MKILYTVVISLMLLSVFVINSENRDEVVIKQSKKIEVEQPMEIEEVYEEEIELEIPKSILQVNAGEDEVVVLGKKITLKATVKEEDEIVSYEWREGDKILSDKERFSTLLPLGVHSILLSVVDNQGRVAKDEVLISVGKYYLIKKVSNKENTTEYNVYNSEGNITKESMDDNNDGLIDRVYFTNYDDEGRIIYRGVDYDNDGILYSETHYTYDDNGNLIEYRYLFEEDNTESVYKYTYNDKNQKIGSVLEEDGIETDIETFIYDDAGKNIKVLIDNNGDGTTDREKFYSYDENSNIIEETLKDMKGDIKKKIIQRYSKNGQRIFYSNDWNDDGEPDMLFEWNDNGDVTLSRYERKEDGTYTYEQNTSYTDSGKIKETTGNWLYEERESTIYTYDKNEENILYVKKYDNKGDNLSKEYYNYDEHGNLIEIVNEEGEVLSSWEYEFIIGER